MSSLGAYLENENPNLCAKTQGFVRKNQKSLTAYLEDYIENTGELGRPVSHEVPTEYLSSKQ